MGEATDQLGQDVIVDTIGKDHPEKIRETLIVERALDRALVLFSKNLIDNTNRNELKSALLGLHGFLLKYGDDDYLEDIKNAVETGRDTVEKEIEKCLIIWTAINRLIKRTPLLQKPFNIYDTKEEVKNDEWKDWSDNQPRLEIGSGEEQEL